MSATRMPKRVEDRPYTSNYPALQEWLHKRNASCQWQRIDGAMSVECWAVGKALCIVVVHANRNGWDIFTPCLDSTIDATLADADKRVGAV